MDSRRRSHLSFICLILIIGGGALHLLLLPGAMDDSTSLTTSYSIPPPPSPQQHQLLPSCLIIGVRKGGTRALLDAMALHPMVRAARRELHFFDHNTTYSLGSEWYRRQMPLVEGGDGVVVVEKSPAYFVSPLAPQRVHLLNPQMRLLLILRDPVIRLISDFTQVSFIRLERNKSVSIFEEVVFLPNGSLNTLYKPVRNSLYARHLSRWLEHFHLKQILVVDGDLFIRDPMRELRRVERFLGVGHRIRRSQLVFDKRKAFYCFKRHHRRRARCLGRSKGRAHIEVSEEVKRRLAEQFHPHNRALFAQMNRSFPKWL